MNLTAKMIIREMLFVQECTEQGIVPIDGSHKSPYHHNVNRILEGLSPVEARAMRRKFRKMWRAVAKKSDSRSYKRQLGLGDPTPRRSQLIARKKAVHTRISQIILPRQREMEERMRSTK